MVFGIINDGKIEDIPVCDIAVAGFGVLGDVDYESELRGQTEKFEQSARFSKRADCGLLCACKTASRGLLRKSCAVSDRGKLLGIADMLHVLDGENYKSGSGLGIYKINGCKIGICIENDLLFPDVFRSMNLCGCNAVVVLLEEIRDNIPALLIRTYAYLYGMPVIMSAGKTAYFADISGAIATSVQEKALFEIIPKNEYHLVTTRTKGITGECRADY